MRKLIYLMTVILGISGVLVIGLYVRTQRQVRELDISPDSIRTYGRHYLFVSSDESQMLQDIYEKTASACEESGAYLEWCGRGAPRHYSAAECVDISTAMKADGIIVYPDGSGDLSDAITRASEAGVPVITILRDLPDSGRVSYAGVSNYQMGDLYGGQLLSLLHNGKNVVCLLTDAGDSENETQLLYTQMVQAVLNGAPSGRTMELRTESVDSRTDFDAEEVIRDILLGRERPDILICLNSVQTECAIQALIEYNLVGKVQVIGYYVTDQILQALRQDLIPVTMTIDTGALGDVCVQALDEYLELGRVSSYYNITLFGVTPMTVERYERERGIDAGQEADG
ncbi:MAG: substrate-binding domain-containing protein [Lachnospiraceae bacterium]|nr:substrate-binding domain-containing protein [Lachnospiraceae bacterium]